MNKISTVELINILVSVRTSIDLNDISSALCDLDKLIEYEKIVRLNEEVKEKKKSIYKDINIVANYRKTLADTHDLKINYTLLSNLHLLYSKYKLFSRDIEKEIKGSEKHEKYYNSLEQLRLNLKLKVKNHVKE